MIIRNLKEVITGGTFAFEVTDLPPTTTTIYFKAYVTNEYGTILSTESSFNIVIPNAPTGSRKCNLSATQQQQEI